MPAVADLHSQIASVMEVLANAAVAEICKAVEDGYAVVNLEMTRSLKENECLRRRVKLLELQVSRYRAEQRLKAPDGSGAGRLFPGVRLLQHRHGRDTPPGPSLLNRPRFLNRPQQKSPSTDLDQDPNQEVVTSSKIELAEPEENSDLIIVKVEGSASPITEDTNNNKNSSTSLDETSEQQAQSSSQTESQESQENSSRIWKSEEQVVKRGDDKKTSPSNGEPHLYPIPTPKWQNNNAKSKQLLNSTAQNKNISSRQHSTTSSNSQEGYPSANLIPNSDLRHEDYLPVVLPKENHTEEIGEVLAFNVNQNASSLSMPPASIQNRQIMGPISKESPALPHLCSFCPHQFAQKKELMWHESVHRAKKPYQCDQCGKIFVSFCHLKRHKLVHTGERPYPCAHCGKKFTTFNNLKVHQSVHTGERKFKCETCGKTYAFHSNLIRHQAVHTKV
ncbi:hypothetical protein NL108_009283 [Boleophthalmus pectinirostris]|uniref:zinc finger protein 3-like n=1 Tax=Boleophthalmus pectinirostris TaxID=150288 RepID=UPI000A1C4155|nr:zinc finger protein 3-like [Boleophthalmus pectinirostris]KAJ0050876.1 hypothetical protein NL108_009283 [Boleophthalmus pectinirostris]